MFSRTFLLSVCTFLGTLTTSLTLGTTLLHPLFKVTTTFFCDVFDVVCATSEKVQMTRGAQVDAIRGLLNVMCTHVLHTKRHIIPGGGGGGREESLGVEVGSSPIKGSHTKFLCTHPRQPKKHSIAVVYGELKATFGSNLVCAAVQHVKTMY